VANCYTQFQFGYDGAVYADAEYVEVCLRDCYSFAELNELDIHAVKIGTGLGGLDWTTEVEPIFLRLNSEYKNTDVSVYYVQE
jgi:hypothetical protein